MYVIFIYFVEIQQNTHFQTIIVLYNFPFEQFSVKKIVFQQFFCWQKPNIALFSVRAL